MSKKRILSFILAALMVVSVLPMTAGAEVAEDYVPDALTLSPAVADTYIVNEDFSGTEYSSLITKRGGRSALSIDAGKLKITHDGTDSSALIGTRIYLNNDQTAKISGTLAVEFTVERMSVGETFTFKTEGTGVTGSHNHWDSSAVFTYDNTGTKSNRGAINGTKAKVTMLLNPALDRQSVRVESLENTSEVVEIRNNTINGDLSECLHVDLFMESAAKDEYFYIDDLKIYESTVPDYEAVLWDKEWLTENEITGSQGNYNLTGTLDLPETGECGSTITWVSSNTNIITNEGVITNPGEDASVTLTATITKGSETATKSLEFKFGEVAYLSPSPAVAGEYIVNEDFSGTTYSSLITKRGSRSAYAIENERLKITHDGSDSSQIIGTRIYLDETNTAKFTGLLAVQFTVERATEGDVFDFKTEGSGLSGAWNYWNGTSVMTNNNGAHAATLGTVKGTKAQITMLLNPELKRQSIRVQSLDDPSQVVEVRNNIVDGVNGNLADCVSIDLALESASSGESFYIDDLKVYQAKAPGTEAVAWDAAVFGESDFLGTQTANSVKTDLTLPATGKYGSNITWASSNENIITNAGKVKRGATAKEVKLTATFAKGIAESETKEFTLTVAPGEFTVGDISYEGTGYNNGTLQAGKVKVILPIHSSVEDIKKVIVVSAVYDEDTKELLSVISEPLSFEQGYDQASGIELTIEKATNYIKTFVWNSLSDLMPLTTVFSLGE